MDAQANVNPLLKFFSNIHKISEQKHLQMPKSPPRKNPQRARKLVRYLQFPAGINDIGTEIIQFFYFRETGSVPKVVLCNLPEGIAAYNCVDPIGLNGL